MSVAMFDVSWNVWRQWQPVSSVGPRIVSVAAKEHAGPGCGVKRMLSLM